MRIFFKECVPLDNESRTESKFRIKFSQMLDDPESAFTPNECDTAYPVHGFVLTERYCYTEILPTLTLRTLLSVPGHIPPPPPNFRFPMLGFARFPPLPFLGGVTARVGANVHWVCGGWGFFPHTGQLTRR